MTKKFNWYLWSFNLKEKWTESQKKTRKKYRSRKKYKHVLIVHNSLIKCFQFTNDRVLRDVWYITRSDSASNQHGVMLVVFFSFVSENADTTSPRAPWFAIQWRRIFHEICSDRTRSTGEAIGRTSSWWSRASLGTFSMDRTFQQLPYNEQVFFAFVLVS